MEDMREMVAALRNLRLEAKPEAIDHLRELRAKATKLGDLVVGCSPRDGNMAPRT